MEEVFFCRHPHLFLFCPFFHQIEVLWVTKMTVFGEGVGRGGLRKYGTDKTRIRSVLRTPDVSSGTGGNVFLNNLVSVYPLRQERVMHGIL